MRLVAVLLLALVSVALATPTGVWVSPLLKHDEDGKASILPSTPSARSCEDCINVAIYIINVVANDILNGGIINTCEDLCGAINSSVISTICELGCDAVGIDVFVKLLSRVDIDPILYCQYVHECLVSDCPDNATGSCVNFTTVTATPTDGYEDTHFKVDVGMNVTQLVGAGMLQVAFFAEGSQPTNMDAEDELVSSYPPGFYTFSIGFEPEQMDMQPGNWTIQITACEGQCGSTHEHSLLLTTIETSFSVSKDTKKPYPIARGGKPFRISLRR